MSSDILAYLPARYLTYLMMFFPACYLANYLAFYLTYLLAFYLTYLLAFYLMYLLVFYLAYLWAFYRTYLLTIPCGIYSDIVSDIWHSIWHIFSHSIWEGRVFYLAFYPPASLRLRSRRAHSDQEPAVETRRRMKRWDRWGDEEEKGFLTVTTLALQGSAWPVARPTINAWFDKLQFGVRSPSHVVVHGFAWSVFSSFLSLAASTLWRHGWSGRARNYVGILHPCFIRQSLSIFNKPSSEAFEGADWALCRTKHIMHILHTANQWFSC